jgi:uncharacterized surface protein with fasciclin (FAS1) repeats
MKRTFLKFAATTVVIALVSACGGSDDNDKKPAGNVAEVATSRGFTSLVAAATKAELVTTLSDSSATLTVFAPTDAAFTALATQLGYTDTTAMVTALSKENLAKILTYHVLSTKVASSAITYDAPVATVQGESITITKGTAPVIATIADTTATASTITAVDVAASNGVIHVVDKVLIPSGIVPN